MTDEELDRMLEVAQAADMMPGNPWVQIDDSQVSVIEYASDGSVAGGRPIASAATADIGNHIATFDPATVTKLITELKAARAR